MVMTAPDVWKRFIETGELDKRNQLSVANGGGGLTRHGLTLTAGISDSFDG